MNGNTRHAHPCPYCSQVLYNKGAYTRHLNQYHTKQMKLDEMKLKEIENGSN